MEKLNEILQIPERCLLFRKLPKTFFKRNFELTLSEKKLLDDTNIVSSIDWLATVSPANANINRYEEGPYLYEEVEIICVQTTQDDFEKNVPKIAELIQKYIPYPILLCIYYDGNFVLNTCEKRINQNDNTRRTMEQRYNSEVIDFANLSDTKVDFLNNIAFSRLDKTNLKTYYDGYSQCITALHTASYSGIFTPRTKERTDADMQTLQKMQTLQIEITTLQNLAKKETQLSQQIVVNTKVQDKRREIEHLRTSLIN